MQGMRSYRVTLLLLNMSLVSAAHQPLCQRIAALAVREADSPLAHFTPITRVVFPCCLSTSLSDSLAMLS